MRICPLVISLFLAFSATLRAVDTPAAQPASHPFIEPAALQPFLKSGVATYAAYGGPNETYLKFTKDWNGTEADLAHFNEFTTSSTVSITGDKNAALILPHLAALPALERLNLSDVTLSSTQIKLLAALKLKLLDIGTNVTTLTLDGLTNVKMLYVNEAVEHLTLTNITALELLIIQGMPDAPSKLTLNIPSAPQLKSLVLKNLTLTNFSLPPALQRIELTDSTAPDALLQQIPQLKNLNYLDLTNMENANVALSGLSDSRLKTIHILPSPPHP